MRPTLLLFYLVVTLQGFLSGNPFTTYAQSPLKNKVTISLYKQPLSSVLLQVSNQGKFHFSYGSNVISSDSLVSLTVINQTVHTVLDQLFQGRIHYKESAEYIILLPSKPTEKQGTIAGKIVDQETSQPIEYASVYTQNLLTASLSNESGAFRLRLKDSSPPQYITVSKLGYQDSTFLVNNTSSSELLVTLRPKIMELDEVVITNTDTYRPFLTKIFVSSRLRMTSQNLGHFFVNLPYQISLTPGVGTHGKMASQIVNKVSLNLIGGYTAGTNGVEMAGVFNIAKHNVQYVQAAGVFNVVTGSGKGVQLAGIHNSVQDSMQGVQMAGFSNVVGGPMKGLQASGGLNKVDSLFSGIQLAGALNRQCVAGRGIQIAGLLNSNQHNFKGLQIAGLLNSTKGTMKGLQLAPINTTKHLKGVQIGIINRAINSEGYSLGILNFIKNGEAHFSLSATDLALFNVAWKTGTRKLYSILTTGLRPDPPTPYILIGFGVGTHWTWNNKASMQMEITQITTIKEQLGSSPNFTRLQIPLNYRFSKQIRVFAGPSLTWQHEKGKIEGDLMDYPSSFKKTKLLLGWQTGINFYYQHKN